MRSPPRAPSATGRRIFEGIDAYLVNGTPADWHSGTLAAAKQATLLGIRGIALSAPADDEETDFAPLEPWIGRVLELLLEDERHRLVSVNFPREPRDIRWTSQAVHQYDGTVVASKDPMGRPIYWFTVVRLEEHVEGTDLWAFHNGYVSLTPLRLDLTDHESLART
jgi:5'/3'-nucleotidase